MLSPKGSSGTCIPEGQTTFLHAACTAHHVLHPGEDALVMATMVHLLCTGRITLRSGIEALASVV